jgi:ribosome maturation factor RimP
MQDNDRLFAELEPLLAGAGLVLVDASAGMHRGSAQARVVVYASGGTGTAECAKAHRLIFPRIQAFTGTEEPYLEVASPGIDRVIRDPREWKIFAGKGARVLLKEGGDWVRGKILSSAPDRVVLACAEGERSINLSSIAKARLDSSQEGD